MDATTEALIRAALALADELKPKGESALSFTTWFTVSLMLAAEDYRAAHPEEKANGGI